MEESVFQLTDCVASKEEILHELLQCADYFWKIEYHGSRSVERMIGPFKKSTIGIEDYHEIPNSNELEHVLTRIEEDSLEVARLIKSRLLDSEQSKDLRSTIETNALEIGMDESEVSILSIAPLSNLVRSFAIAGVNKGEFVFLLNKSLAEQMRLQWLDHGFLGYFELLRFSAKGQLHRLACSMIP